MINKTLHLQQADSWLFVEHYPPYKIDSKMSNTEYQKGSSSFLLKFITAIILFIALVAYVVSQNGEALMQY